MGVVSLIHIHRPNGSVAIMSTLLLVYLHPSIAETGKGFPAAVPATGCVGHRKDDW